LAPAVARVGRKSSHVARATRVTSRLREEKGKSCEAVEPEKRDDAGGIVAGLALASPASATLLGNPVNFPLLSFDNGGTANYDATADLFSVNANPIALRLGPGAPPRFVTANPPEAGEFFTINISVDDSGKPDRRYGRRRPRRVRLRGSRRRWHERRQRPAAHR
jgi:hypothetical protein